LYVNLQYIYIIIFNCAVAGWRAHAPIDQSQLALPLLQDPEFAEGRSDESASLSATIGTIPTADLKYFGGKAIGFGGCVDTFV
jgi:hypothetical protein